MSRRSMAVSLLAGSLALPTATVPAQTFNQPRVPQVVTQVPSAPQQLGAGGSASAGGTGPYTVWVAEPNNNQSFSLGNASTLVFKNASGAVVTPTSTMSGSVQIYFPPNNMLVQSAVHQSCVAQRNCAGPYPSVIITTTQAGGYVTYYTASAATIVSLTAGLYGGGSSVVSFQRLFIQTNPPPAPAQPSSNRTQ